MCVGCTAQPMATQVDAFVALSCANDLPTACPSTIPSWKTSVQPLIAQQCGSCHTQNGSDATRPFDTYAQVSREPGAMLDQIFACTMPPALDTVLQPSERQTLLTWLVCGAPEN
jgi:hypothetical protein